MSAFRTLGLKIAAVLAVLLTSAQTMHAQTPPDTGRVLALWPEGAPGALGTAEADRPSLTVYLPRPEIANGTAVLIFPGGGYRRLAVEKEGIQAVRWMNSLGVAAFVVQYRIGPRYHHPAMLRDAQRAIRTVRARAEEWGVDPGRVGVMGFSAGGHLAATAGVHFAPGRATPADPIDAQDPRPDFMVLAYPVVTMQGPAVHAGSRDHLLGTDPDPALVELLSVERHVTPQAPPTFLVASTDDAAVPVENTLLFYQALRNAGVPVEMHVYQNGEHGFGLAPRDPVLRSWLALCEAWLKRGGWL